MTTTTYRAIYREQVQGPAPDDLGYRPAKEYAPIPTSTEKLYEVPNLPHAPDWPQAWQTAEEGTPEGYELASLEIA